ncbi:hypothetical protein FQA39_LY12751 [Lamprigera yunnana]|nr:hypothetical protein FQA39_LY12751 [Lamprigera yunnana]
MCLCEVALLFASAELFLRDIVDRVATAYGAPLTFGTPATPAQSGFGSFGSTFGSPQTAFGPASTQQPAFGSTVPQQPSFGSPFGQTAAGATAPAFGTAFGQTANAAPAFGAPAFGTSSTAPGFGSTFGAPATSSSAFGTTFGTPATSAPAFGSAFGATTSTAPAFGSAFGAAGGSAITSTAPAFGSTFGTTGSSAPSLFGAPPATNPSLFGTPPTTAPSLFGAPSATPGLFGATATTQASGLFGNPVATSTTPSLFGTSTSTAPSLFNPSFGAPSTTTPSLFGGSGATGFSLGTTTAGNTGFGLFGAGTTTTSAPSLFSGFGKTTTASGFTGFGTGFSGFGATSTAPSWGANTTFSGVRPPNAPGIAPVQQPSPLQQTLGSFYAINIFGDERDTVLKKWNMLQGCWGTGKGFYNPSQPPIDYNFINPLYRFKAVGYVVVPDEDNARGFIKLIFNKKDTELINQKEALINGILGILGNKPNLTVILDHIKAVADNQSEVMFYVTEKGITGSVRNIPALDLCAFLNQNVQKQQLTNVGVTYIGAYITPTKDQLQEYLKNPPAGIESQMWQAAQADNPNPYKFMPTPLNGFSDLKKRMLCQQYETDLHQSYLNQVGRDIVEWKKKHANSVAKINEQKQKYAELHHRLLKIIIKQEMTRKLGMAIQPEEELLRGRFEAIVNKLSTPTQFKGQLHDMRCNMTLSNAITYNEEYEMDAKIQEEIKDFLKMEQNGITQLINIIKTDMQNLKIISEGLEKIKNKQ